MKYFKILSYLTVIPFIKTSVVGWIGRNLSFWWLIQNSIAIKMNTSFCDHISLVTEWNDSNDLSFYNIFFLHFDAFWNVLIYVGVRSFQKKFKRLLQPWRLNYMILALNESMKIFLAKYTASVCSTEPAWLAYVQAGTPPS